MTRSAFRRQGPFVGSGGLYSPGPATIPPLARAKQPLDDALTSPWVCADPFTVMSDDVRRRDSFSLEASCLRVTADPHSGLGPRSLAWWLFLELRAREYSRPGVAWRLLQLHTTYEQPNRSSRFLAGTKAWTFFLF